MLSELWVGSGIRKKLTPGPGSRDQKSIGSLVQIINTDDDRFLTYLIGQDTHLSGQASEEVDLLARMLAERIDLTHPLLLTVGAKQLDIPTIKDLVTFVAEKF
jgi:hypothetical protein